MYFQLLPGEMMRCEAHTLHAFFFWCPGLVFYVKTSKEKTKTKKKIELHVHYTCNKNHIHVEKNNKNLLIKLSIKFKTATVSKTLVSRRERWSVHITHLITIHVTIRHWRHQLTLQLFLWFVPWRQRNTKETGQTSWIIFRRLCFVTLQTRERERKRETGRERGSERGRERERESKQE